jgi:hypothetical protein
MKTAEEWHSDFSLNKSLFGDLQTIKGIQKEAWNEAIRAAAESADWDCDNNHENIIVDNLLFKRNGLYRKLSSSLISKEGY